MSAADNIDRQTATPAQKPNAGSSRLKKGLALDFFTVQYQSSGQTTAPGGASEEGELFGVLESIWTLPYSSSWHTMSKTLFLFVNK